MSNTYYLNTNKLVLKQALHDRNVKSHSRTQAVKVLLAYLSIVRKLRRGRRIHKCLSHDVVALADCARQDLPILNM